MAGFFISWGIFQDDSQASSEKQKIRQRHESNDSPLQRQRRGEILAGEVGEDGFGGAAAAVHGTVDGSVVAMIAGDVDARADANGAFRRFESAGKLLGLGVGDAIAF